MRKLLLAAAAAAAMTTAATTVAGAQTGATGARTAAAPLGATGNAQAIAFERSVQRAYGHVPGIDYTQSGFVVIADRRGPHASFKWRWGIGRAAGLYRATETAVVGLRRGRTVWVLDTLTAPRHTPVQILLSRRGQFWRFAGRRHLGCFNPLAGTVPWRVGARWITVGGAHYLPLIDRPPDVLSRHRFPWSTDQTALETDTVSPVSHLLLSYVISVPRGHQAGEPAFKFSAVYDNLTRAPREPRVTLCH